MEAKSNRPDPSRIQTVWWTPELTSPEFLAWTEEAIYWLEECPLEKAAEVRRRLEAGEKPALVMPPEAEVVPLSKLLSVTLDRNAESLTLDYGADPDDLESQEITLRDPATRDRLFDALQRHLGDRWKTNENKYTASDAMWAPILWMLAVLGGTAFLWWLACDVAEKAAQGPLQAKGWKGWLFTEALHYLTPTGVLILGGLMLGLLALWLLARIQQPPHELILIKTSD